MSRPVLVYDGDCSFCTAWARWVAAKTQPRVCAVTWQSLSGDELTALGLTADEAGEAAWWIDDRGRSRGHLAIAHALAAGRGWSAVLGRVLLVPPFRWVAAAGYPLVARWRNRLPRP
jgi:predicted DCC family thiol-disulfide oxidoreductase YuxK